ncbi:hypothetical protein R3P38DRAFT_537804 [Favolaschia claudopus]|uniref:Polymerase nucleotidyl transferase domain-containing protein n=1 Tax=Favolaschia claudopus TaxID=2862362 RepID=A0AAW0CIH5_9AGAR
MDHAHVSSLLKTLQIPSKIHTVYLIGSRLWGTHSPKSDFDLLIVTADTRSSFPKSQHKGNYDATIITETEFRQQVESGSLIESLCCLFPGTEECVLAVDVTRNRRALIGKDQLQKMRLWVDERTQKDREKAMKFWTKGSETRQKGWKILQHSIAAESILHGLHEIIEEEKVDLQDIALRQVTVQRLVTEGREDDDRDWLAKDWKDVDTEHRTRLQRLKIMP